MRMWKILAAICGLFLVPACDAAAAVICTLVVGAADGQVQHESGDCAMRNSPASTFKIPLAVMGFDAGILQDAHAPLWPYREDYKAWNARSKKATDPASWLQDSVLWYSQVLTRQMGMPNLRRHVDGFGYGNRVLAGDPGQDNALTHAWLNSSLQISSREQVDFLRKLRARGLPVSRQAQDMAIAIMPVFAGGDGWTVSGKTGSGFQRKADGAIDRSRAFGWFVGWAVKEQRAVVFARLVRDDGGTATTAGPKTRDSILADLPKLVSPP